MSVLKKIHTLISIETKSYKQKGLINIVLAFALLFGMMKSAGYIGEKYWPSIIQDKVNFIFFGSVIIHTLFQLIIFSLYLPGYLGVNWFYKKYLINKKSLKPWQKNNWPEMRRKNIYNLILNQLIVYPILVFFSSSIGVRVRFDSFPTWVELFWQTFFIYFVEDFFSYWAHRFLHQYPVLYKLHKIHHQYDTLHTLATEYFHPIDYIFSVLIPSAMGFIFLGNRAHCFTFFFWIAWKVIASSQGHSGYEIPWSPFRIMPLITGPSFHDYHHSHNVGNYAGSCLFWDLLLDTSVPYFDQYLKEQQKEAKNS